MKLTQDTQHSQLLNSALRLHNDGNLDAADQIYESILEKDEKDFDANHLHGLILSQKQKHEEALPFLKLAVEQKQNDFHANNNLGIAYKRLEEYDSAEKCFLKAISLEKNNFMPYFNCANVYMESSRYDEALDFLLICKDLEKNSANILATIGEVYRLKFLKTKDEELLIPAKKFLKQAITINPEEVEPYVSLAMISLWLGDIKESVKLFEQHNSIIMSHQEIGQELKDRMFKDSALEAMIKHEFEQLRFIIHNYKNFKSDESWYEFLKEHYEKIERGDFQPKLINNKNKRALVNQVYKSSPKCSLENYVNSDNNISELETQYKSVSPEVMVVDNFLEQEALIELQKLCYSSNIFKHPYPEGYLGAFLEYGLANEFILKLSEDIRKTFKNICANTKLTQAWIFKYDSRIKSSGINIHADDAKVNLNFWITPQKSNLKPEEGGLIIWNKFPEKGATFADFNYSENSEPTGKMLAEKKIKYSKIAYKENRAVFFNSMLFHATDGYKFDQGYEDRRINVTFLYN